MGSFRLLWTRFVCQRSCLEFRNFPPFKELGDDKRRTDAYFAAEANGQRVPLQNGSHEDLLYDLVRCWCGAWSRHLPRPSTGASIGLRGYGSHGGRPDLHTEIVPRC
jgi:hypothetical protein